MGDSKNDHTSSSHSSSGDNQLGLSSDQTTIVSESQFSTKSKNASKIQYYRDSTLADNFLRFCEIKSKAEKNPQDLRFEKAFEESTKKEIVKALQEYENLIQEKEELKRKRQLQITDNEDKLKLILEENKELIKQIELKTDLLESQEETIANLNLEMVTMNAKIAKLTKTKGQRSKSKLQTEDKGKDSADSDSSLGGDDENEEDDSGKQSSTQTSSNTLTINTPVKQIKYNEKQADKMDLETLTTLYIKLVSYKKPKQTQEATKFKLKMIEKSKKMDQEINAMKTRLTQLQNELASLQEKYQQNVSADKVNEQVVELLKSKQKLEKEIKNLRDLTDKQLQEKLDLNSIINDIGNREVKLNEELINAQDEIKEKNKLIIDYQKTVTEL